MFFNLKGLNNSKESENSKAMILLNYLESNHYKLLVRLTAPELPNSKTFDVIINLLKEHLIPRKNILIEQFTTVKLHDNCISCM